MRRMSTIGALLVTLGLAACGGGGGRGETSSQARARSYAAGVVAQRQGDAEVAYRRFHDAGDYRDAPQRLLAMRHAVVTPILALARSKLRTGHPRAALALAGIATQKFGDTDAQAVALLHQAQTAQARHHGQQLAQESQTVGKQGRSP